MITRSLFAPDGNHSSPHGGQHPPDGVALDLQAGFGATTAEAPEDNDRVLIMGLIDCYRFSQECLAKVFESLDPQLTVHGFLSVADCQERRPADLDVIIYYSHSTNASEAVFSETVSELREAFPDIPLIVLSDAEDAHQRRTIRTTLRNGAHGFIPTRTTGIPIALAAIRLVKAGGTFAPLDLLLTNRPDHVAAMPAAIRPSRLTTRQMAVLGHLQQGKANKVIARELGMSESTVKVHVRDIMRKMGATNRTEAAYKAQKIWENAELAKISEP